MADEYLHNRIDEILRQRIQMGAGDASEIYDYVGGYAKGKPMTKTDYNKRWKNKHGNLKGAKAAWDALQKKRAANKKTKDNPKTKKTKPKAKPKARKTKAKGLSEWQKLVKKYRRKGYSLAQISSMYRRGDV